MDFGVNLKIAEDQKLLQEPLLFSLKLYDKFFPPS
jgi:hypothetical protein